MWQNHPDQHSDWWNEERASNVCRDVLHVEQDDWQCFGTWYKARRSSGKVKRPFRSYPFCLLLVLNVQSRRCSTSRQRKWTHVVRSCEFFLRLSVCYYTDYRFLVHLIFERGGNDQKPPFQLLFPAEDRFIVIRIRISLGNCSHKWSVIRYLMEQSIAGKQTAQENSNPGIQYIDEVFTLVCWLTHS